MPFSPSRRMTLPTATKMPHVILLISAGLVLAGKGVSKLRQKSAKKHGLISPPDGREVALLPSSGEPAAASGREVIGEGEAEDNAEKINREFAVATASLGSITAATLFFPPPASFFLTVAGVTGILHSLVSLLKESHKSVFEEKRVGVEVVDSIAVTGFLIGHYYFLCALADWVYFTGQKLVIKVKSDSRRSLVGSLGELPDAVWVVRDGIEIEVPLATVHPDDVVAVIAGGLVPADGVIVEGVALIDQHLLTGEAQPSEKGIGEQVFASTVVLSGRIYIRVRESGSDTVVAKIDEILRNATDFKASIQLRGEELADKTALPTLALSGLALATMGPVSAMSALNGYVGDDMTMIGPISTLNYLRIASQSGILIKDGRGLESLGAVDTVVFDKTGTLTRMQPHVGKIHAFLGYGETELLRFAAAAESRQAHPIARAISREARRRGITPPSIGDVDYELGFGIRMRVEGSVIRVGSIRFIELEGVSLTDQARAVALYCHEQGYSPVMVAVDGELAGAIELHPTIRPEVKNVIGGLRQRSLDLYIISGDHEMATGRLADQLGIENVFAEVLPEDKAELVKRLKAEGKTVCFVGDGINDSVAMKEAHVSISLSGASAIATSTAQIILMDGDLRRLGQLFDLAEELKTNLNVSFLAVIVPGVVTVGAVFFLNLGLVGSTILYITGLTTAMINSMLPLIKRRESSVPDRVTEHGELAASGSVVTL